MPTQKHRVVLTPEQRATLLERLGRGSCPVREQTRIRVLLKVDQGPEGPAWTDARTAEALEISKQTVYGLRRRLQKRGLIGTIQRKAPDRVYRTKLDGEQEAKLIQLACSGAPEGHSQWSLRLLADQMVALDIVDAISHETVRKTLKKTVFSPIEAANG